MPPTPRTPPLVIVLVVVAGVGACLIAAASFASGTLGWPGFAVGFVALVASLVALWVIQKRRDRTMR
jgi:bacteriorhodopsin